MNQLLFLNIGAAEIIILAFVLIGFGLFFYCLILMVKDSSLSTIEKLIWFFLLLCFPLIGSIAYLIVRRKSQPRNRVSSHL